MAAVAAPGNVSVIGVAGRVASVTFVNPADKAVAFQTMLYLSGESVVALYVSEALVVPAHTEGFVPNVIVGSTQIVMLPQLPGELRQLPSPRA